MKREYEYTDKMNGEAWEAIREVESSIRDNSYTEISSLYANYKGKIYDNKSSEWERIYTEYKNKLDLIVKNYKIQMKKNKLQEDFK